MAETGIIYRRNTKAKLLVNPPILGEVVFAIDTEEYGAIENNTLIWRKHISSGVVDHTELTNIGTNTHVEIDAFISSKGSNDGLAELDSNGLIPSGQLPSFVDDVLEYDDSGQFPSTGTSGKIYIAIDTNITYRWSGSIYVSIGSDLALGENETTAYRGDRGKIAYDHSQVPHAPASADNTGINETSHSDVLVDGDFTTSGLMKTDGSGGYSIDTNTYLTSETSHSDVLVDSEFSTSGLMKTDGSGGYSIDTNTYLTSETSHSDVLVDGDFTTSGLMKTDGSGGYSIDTNTYLTSETSHPADDLQAQNITDINNLSGTNSGDQTTITGNAGTVTNGVYTTDIGVNVLAPDGDGSQLTNLPSGFTDPMTTRGDIIVKDATNTTDRLPIGSVGKVISSDGTDLFWADPEVTLSTSQILSNKQLKAYTETSSVTSVSASTHNIDLSLANVFDITLENDVTFTFTNAPSSGIVKNCTIILRQDSTGSRLATFTNANYTDGELPILTTASDAIDVLSFFTLDAGNFWFGTFAMADVS